MCRSTLCQLFASSLELQFSAIVFSRLKLFTLEQKTLANMSKNKRKRRLKEEDFKKKKLKVGRKLPMPDNVTKTSFKARSVNISQQNLKQDIEQSGTNLKGRHLKELLRSCSHYNIKAREETLSGLKDLFQNYPGILKDNLNAALQQILHLMTDVESSVRKRLLALLSVIFQSLSETEISPFFASIVAYLCSAMTHLDESIRSDSMKFLDLCLDAFPRLVKAHAKNIIINFINVISMKKSDVVNSSGVVIKSEWKAKVMSQQTQLQVLSQLNRLLRVVCVDSPNPQCSKINSKFSRSSSNEDTSTKSPSSTSTKPNPVTIIEMSASSCQVSNLQPTLVSSFSLKTTSEFENSTTSVDWLKEFVCSLTPVFFEYWVECCPAEFTVNLIPIKKVPVSLQIMKEILEILLTLVESCKKNTSDPEWFHSFLNNEVGCLVQTHFTPVFPLSFRVHQSERKSTAHSVESITDVKMNILIAQILTYYIGGNSLKSPSSVLVYLQDMLNAQLTNKQQFKLIASDMKSITSLIMKIYSLDMPQYLEEKKILLLDVLYQLFESSHSATLNIWLDFLAEVVHDASNQKESMVLILAKWLKSLLNILNKDITQEFKYKILFIYKSGILQRFPHLTDAIADELPRIFAVANYSKFNMKLQKLVLEIFYHNNQVPSRELYGILVKLCNSGCLLLQVFEYLLFVIHEVVHSSSTVLTLANYLSFMLTVTMGHTQKQLEHIQTETHGQPYCYNFKEISEVYTIVGDFASRNVDLQVTKESWERASKLNEVVCQLLAQSDYSTRFLEMLKVPLLEFFSKYPTLPLEVVYRLLYLVKHLLNFRKDGEAEDHCHSKLLTAIATWCSVLWHFLVKICAETRVKVYFMIVLANQLKAIMSGLCKSSETILKKMLDLFTIYAEHDPELTCEVVTDMLQELKITLGPIHLSLLNDLCKILKTAADNKKLNSSTFSCFEEQYKICTGTRKSH